MFRILILILMIIFLHNSSNLIEFQTNLIKFKKRNQISFLLIKLIQFRKIKGNKLMTFYHFNKQPHKP